VQKDINEWNIMAADWMYISTWV